jgi:hypothetical protein
MYKFEDNYMYKCDNVANYTKFMKKRFQKFVRNKTSDTIFVALYTHGELWLDERNNLDAIKGLIRVNRLTVISENQPGKINICETEHSIEKIKRVNNYLHEINNETIAEDTPLTIQTIVDEMIIYDEENPTSEQLDQDVKEQLDVKTDEKYLDYESTKGLYRTVIYNKDDNIARKGFSGNYNEDYVLVLDYYTNRMIDIAYEWKKGNKFEFETLDLLNFLQNNGFDNIVLIDLSCSLFTTTNISNIAFGESSRVYNGDNRRYLQYKMMTDGLAGGKCIKKKKLTNKKKMVKRRRNTVRR